MPAPTVTTISPRTGGVTGGSSVTITGTNFTGTTGVTIGGAAATSVVVVNDTTITCKTPTGSEGTASVLVTNGSGTNGANSLYIFVPKDARPLYVYLQGGRGDSYATATWNGLEPTEETTTEKSEFYRDIFSGVSDIKVGGGPSGPMNFVSAQTVVIYEDPVSYPTTLGTLSAAPKAATSDQVAHVPPRQADKSVAWLIFNDEDGTPYKFRKALVIGWGNNPRD